MPKVWEPGRKEDLLRRLESLRVDSKARWGSFTPARMLEHCAGGMLAGLGELALTPKKTFLSAGPMPKLIIYVLPWPKGAPTAPELLPASEPDFDQAKANFCKALDRFAAAGPNGAFVPHAAFGALSGPDWGALTHRHIDHHWRQFGI